MTTEQYFESLPQIDGNFIHYVCQCIKANERCGMCFEKEFTKWLVRLVRDKHRDRETPRNQLYLVGKQGIGKTTFLRYFKLESFAKETSNDHFLRSDYDMWKDLFCVKVNYIDLKYRNVTPDQLWGEAYAAYKNLRKGGFDDFSIGQEELSMRAAYNKQFR